MTVNVNGNDYESEGVAIAEGLFAIAYALKMLGNGNASTEVGAIEGLAMSLNEAIGMGAHTIAESIPVG